MQSVSSRSPAEFPVPSTCVGANPAPTTATEYRRQASTRHLAGNYRETIACWEKAIELDGGNASDYTGRAMAWEALGDYQQALADYSTTLRLQPNHALTYVLRGVCWQKVGQYDQAIADFQHFITRRPDSSSAHWYLAWLHATCPDERYRNGSKAFQHAQKCHQLSKGKVGLDVLAAACAASGDFEQARRWQLKQVARATSAAERAQQRSVLELYEQGKLWLRDPQTL